MLLLKGSWDSRDHLLLSLAVQRHQTNWFVVAGKLRNHPLTQAKDPLFYTPDSCAAEWSRIMKGNKDLCEAEESAVAKLIEKYTEEQMKFLETQGTLDSCDAD